MDLKNYDIHAVTGVVKKYLRQLPDPAIPTECQQDIIKIYGKVKNNSKKKEKKKTYT